MQLWERVELDKRSVVGSDPQQLADQIKVEEQRCEALQERLDQGEKDTENDALETQDRLQTEEIRKVFVLCYPEQAASDERGLRTAGEASTSGQHAVASPTTATRRKLAGTETKVSCQLILWLAPFLHTFLTVSRPFLLRFFSFFVRFHRLAETVPTSPKPEPRAKKQPARGPRGENSPLRSTRQALTKGSTGSARSSTCLLYTSPSPRDKRQSRMPSSA